MIQATNFIFILTRLGLFLSFSGTVMVSFSFGRNREDANQPDEKGRPVYLASFLHPKLFKLGLSLISFGFIFQFVGTFI